MLRAVILTLALALPATLVANNDDSGRSDTADLVGILRALHEYQCGFSTWWPKGPPLVISDRPEDAPFNVTTKRPVTMFGIDLVPRAAAGARWPQVALCPGLSVVDHAQIERLTYRRGALPKFVEAFELAFAGARSYETITLPAYSADGHRAVIYREHHCGLCGDGTYFELTRTAYGWRVSRNYRAWVS